MALRSPGMREHAALCAYGVRCRRLHKDDLEQVRHWRNMPEVNRFMKYRQYITPEMQLAWFERISGGCNHYFVIESNGNSLGAVFIKNIDWARGSGESGIFIGKRGQEASFIPAVALTLVVEFAFNSLNLGYLQYYIHRDNRRSQSLSQFFGGVLLDDAQDGDQLCFRLTREVFEQNTSRVLAFLSRYHDHPGGA
jgi:RimJ/RimL family protein N-acetyltransferase